MVGQVPQLRVGAPQGLHLEAQSIVEVNAEGPHSTRAWWRWPASTRRSVGSPLAVVVDEGQRAHDLPLAARLVLDQAAAN